MTPSQIIALIRDVLVIGALAFVVFRIYHDGENAVKVQDMQAVQKRLDDNAKQEGQWAQEARDAEFQRAQDMAQVRTTIAAQRAPILVRVPANSGPVSCYSTAATSEPAGTGGNISGTGADPLTIDVRQAINGYEQRVEGIVASCRAALASWPHN